MKKIYTEADLRRIKYLASVRENNNIDFRSFLKHRDKAEVYRIVNVNCIKKS
jgi:hypothetical protein